MNLLVDPVFRVETPDGQQSMSLPALLAALGEDRVEALSGLQRHQEDAFHIFLCYLAGAVLARTGKERPVQDEVFWREGIRRLTGRQDDYAWTLVLEDVTQPAFMQAALADKSLFANFHTKEPKARTPDELDLLATAKNHDCKQAQSAQPAIDDWIYALISLQTSTCYGGRGNYGIARINGTSARPCVQIMDSARYGLRWQQDVTRLLRYRPKLLDQYPYDALGIVLTWVPPWDLKASLALDALDPFFIEISRAVRLTATDSGIRVLGAASEPRVIAKAQRDKLKGNLGDPWTPINHKSGGAVVLGKNSLTPRVLHDLLFAEIDSDSPFKPCAFMQQDTGAPTEALFHVTALARRGGTDSSTEGFHAADIPIPGKVKLSLMRRDTEAQRLGKVSRERLNDASVMENKVLNPALLALLEGGPEKIDYDKRELNAWRERAIQTYAEAWAADFFPWLWRTLDEVDADAARLAWLRSLQDKAWRAFQGAIERYPARSGRRYRARVRAEGVFRGALYNHFPQLKEAQRVTN
ncbi:MAG: type I-E CRISPR-associated protein Cse1/CasA [Myxococcota bacterium]|nr:type I-E CRISPR-associated protein Cse1/CasA [Myxococcota bacterium]